MDGEWMVNGWLMMVHNCLERLIFRKFQAVGSFTHLAGWLTDQDGGNLCFRKSLRGGLSRFNV